MNKGGSLDMLHRSAILLGMICALAISWPFVAYAQGLDDGDDSDLQALGLVLVGQGLLVSEIVDGDTLVLHDGREVRLVGIQAPKLPLGRKGFRSWPLAQEAKDRLASLTLGRRVALYSGEAGTDRHNRVLAHITVHNDQGTVWVQQRLLSDGLARVYSFADNRLALAPLFDAESRARRAARGLWAENFYRVWTAQKIAEAVKSRSYSGDRFELVEGRVVDVTLFRDRAYLNFGPDWRDDFSVMIKAEDFRYFGESAAQAEGFLRGLKGRQVRVRGWTYYKNGPMMRITHKERLTLLPEM